MTKESFFHLLVSKEKKLRMKEKLINCVGFADKSSFSTAVDDANKREQGVTVMENKSERYSWAERSKKMK